MAAIPSATKASKALVGGPFNGTIYEDGPEAAAIFAVCRVTVDSENRIFQRQADGDLVIGVQGLSGRHSKLTSVHRNGAWEGLAYKP